MRDVFTEADYAEVRAGVLARVRRSRRPVGVWVAAAAALLVLVSAGVVWRRTMRDVELPGAPRIAVNVHVRAPAPAPEHHVIARAHRRVSPVKKTEEQPLLVKLETSDPDVVIYWIVESKGGM